MKFTEISRLATHLPGSWLLTQSDLDNALNSSSLENADKVASRWLYKKIKHGLETDSRYKDPVYEQSLKELLSQLEVDPDVVAGLEDEKERKAQQDRWAASLYSSKNNPTGIANPAEYMSSVTKTEEDTDGDGNIDKVTIEKEEE